MLRAESFAYPFQVTAHAGLGFDQSAFTQLTDLVPHTAVGRMPLSCHVNAVNGNLCIADKPITLHSAATPLTIAYVYNAQSATPWQLHATHQIIAQDTQTMQLQDVDGHISTYIYDAEHERYVGPASADGTPYIKLTTTDGKQTYTWHHPHTRSTDYFNPQGLVERRIDANGHVISFDYDNYQLSKISLPDGSALQVQRQGRTVTLVRIINQIATPWHTYSLDDNGNLLTSQPASGDSAHYTYHEGKLSNITQTDGTELHFEFQHDKLTALAAGDRKFKFAYQAQQTVITDALDKNIQLTFDNQQQLITLQQMRDTTSVEYYVNGQVKNIQHANSSMSCYDYDAISGLLVKHIDRSGGLYEFQYDNELLTAKSFIDPQTNQTALTTRYIYNTQNNVPQLRFEISPAGRVTEYSYNAQGLRASTRHYWQTFFTSTNASLSSLIAWAQPQQAHSTLSTNDYDAQGRLTITKTYSAIDATGQGIESSATVIKKSWNAFDQCAISQVLLNAEQQQFCITKTAYDGNDLPLMEQVAAGSHAMQHTQYDYGVGTALMQQTNKAIRQQFDASGLLQAETAGFADCQEQTQYQRDTNGEISCILFCDKTQCYQLYDEAHRLRFSISAAGAVTEHRYDVAKKLSTTICYASPIDVETVQNSGKLDAARLTNQLQQLQTDPRNRIAHVITDDKNQPRFIVDAAGALIEKRYDARGNLLAKIAYAEVLTADEQVALLAGNAFKRKIDTKCDRVERFAYDADGHRILEQDAAGYITQHDYDAGSRNTASHRYTRAFAHLDDLTISGLTPRSSPTATTYKIYDAANRLIAEVDSEGYLTTFDYYPHNKVQHSTRWMNKVSADWFDSDRNSVPCVTPDPEDAHTHFVYNERLLLTEKHEPHHKITRYQYDAQDHEIAQRIEYTGDAHNTSHALNPDNIRNHQQVYDAEGRVILEISPLVAAEMQRIETDSHLAPAEKQRLIDQLKTDYGTHHVYVEGLKVQTRDAHGSSFYYYDQDKRLRASIDASGAVIQYTYDTAFDEHSTQMAYATRLTAEAYAELQGGWWTEALAQQIAALTTTDDQQQQWQYDTRGHITQHTDAEHHTTTFAYNSFGEVNEEQHPTETDAPLIIKHAYDGRGLKTATHQQHAESQFATDETWLHDFNGKVIEHKDVDGYRTHYDYDCLGRLLATHQEIEANTFKTVSELHYDAHHRVTRETDGNGDSKQHHYAGLTETILYADHSSETIRRNIFNEIISHTDGNNHTERYSHNADGKVETITDALNNSETIEYGLDGLKRAHIDKDHCKTTYAYEHGYLTEQVVDADGAKCTTTYHVNAFGKNEAITDARGNQTRYAFNRNNEVVSTIKDPTGLGLLTQHTYGALGKTSIMQGDVKDGNQYLVHLQHDVLGRETTKIIDPLTVQHADALNLTSSKHYDNRGNVLQETDAAGFRAFHCYNGAKQKRFSYEPIDATSGRLLEWQYDAKGQVILARAYDQAIDKPLNTRLEDWQAQAAKIASTADGVAQSFFDARGNEIFHVTRWNRESLGLQGHITFKQYDAANNCIASTNALTIAFGSQETITLDALNHYVTSSSARDKFITTRHIFDERNQERFSIDGEKYVTEKRYDAKGRVIATIKYHQPLKCDQHLMSYSEAQLRDKLTALIAHPDSDSITQTFYHQAFDKPIYQIDATGTVKYYAYDAKGNCTQSVMFKKRIAVILDRDALLQTLQALTPDKDHDNITTFAYDAVDRNTTTTDALGYTEKHTYTALNSLATRKDKNNNLHTNEYDRANRVSARISPEALVTFTERQADGKLAAKTKRLRVKKRLNYDRASNINEIIEGEGLPNQRSISMTYNADHQLIETLYKDRCFDDPSKDSSFDSLPEITADIKLKRTLDSRGRLVYEVKDDGRYFYYLYDNLGRKIFTITGMGGVSEHIYDDAQNLCTEKRYATRIQLNSEKYRAGIAVETLRSDLADSKYRGVYYTYDNNKNVSSIQGEATTYYHNGKLGQATPITKRHCNYQGKCTYEAKLIQHDPELWSEIFRWYNAAGDLVAMVDADNYLTIYERDIKGHETARFEYANALDAEISEALTVAQLQALVTLNPEKDAVFRTDYNQRFDKVAEKIENVVNQHVDLIEGKPVITDLPAQDLKKTYQHDGNGNVIKLTHEDGRSQYQFYNERNSLIAETAIARTPLNSAEAITPLTSYGIDAFNKAVTKTQYAQSVKVETAGVLPKVATSDNDRTDISVVDNVGLTKFKQDAEAHVTAYTYSIGKKLQRKFIKETTYKKLDESDDPQYGIEEHIDSVLYLRDSENNMSLCKTTRDNAIETATGYIYNGYGEYEGMTGSGPGISATQKHDDNGHVYYNDKDCPTLTLRNLAGVETLSLTSATLKLNDKTLADIPALLAEKPDIVERHETIVDLAGHTAAVKSADWVETNHDGRPSHKYERDRHKNVIQEEDSFGHRTEHTFDRANRHIKTVLPETDSMDEHKVVTRIKPTTTFAHNARSQVIGTTDANNHSSIDILDEAGQLITHVLGDGTKDKSYTIDIFGNKTEIIDARTKVTKLEYSKRNSPTKMTLPSGKVKQYEYNTSNKRTNNVDEFGYNHRFNFDARHNITERYQPMGQVTKIGWDHNHLPLVKVQPNNWYEKWERLPNGQPTLYQNLGGEVTHYDLDNKNQVTREYADNAAHGDRMYLNYQIPIDVYHVPPSNKSIVNTFKYGLKVISNDVSFNKMTSYKYDSERRKTEVIISENSTNLLIKHMSCKYDEIGRDKLNEDQFFTATGGYTYFTNTRYFDSVGNIRYEDFSLDPSIVNGGRGAKQNFDRAYLFDAANRPLTINTIFLTNNTINLQPGRGQILHWENGYRVKEEYLDGNNIRIFGNIIFDEDGNVSRTDASNGMSTWTDIVKRGLRRDGTGATTSIVFHELFHGRDYGAFTDINIDANRRVMSSHRLDQHKDMTTWNNYPKDWDVPFEQHTGCVVDNWNGTNIDTERSYRGFDYFKPFGATSRRYEDGAVGIGVMFYYPNGMLNGKMDTQDESIQNDVNNVYFDAVHDGYMLSRQATGMLDDPRQVKQNHGFYFFTTVNNHFIGEYPELVRFRDTTSGAGRYQPSMGIWVIPSYLRYIARLDYLPQPASIVPEWLQIDPYPSSISQPYIVKLGDTFASIAQEYCSDSDFAETIQEANGWLMQQPLVPETVLFLPPYVANHYNHKSNLAYSQFINAIEGSVLPYLSIPKPKKKHHSWFKTIIKIVAVALVITFAQAAAGYLLAANGAGLYATLGLSAVVSESTAAAITTGVLAAIGEAAYQGLAVSVGLQDHFSLSEAVETGLTAGIAAGPLQHLQDAQTIEATLTALAEVSAAAVGAQLTQMALGYRKKFDAGAILEQIAATYLGSKITTTVKSMQLNPNVEIAATSTANTLMESTLGLGLHHTPIDAEALAANAIGSTLGNELSARIPNQQLAAEHVVDADMRSPQRASAQLSRHQAHMQHQSAHPATRQRPASATPAYDAASDPMTLADEVTTFAQLYHKAYSETVTPQSAPATRVERWNNTAKKDWSSLIDDMPFSARLAVGFTSPMEKITAAISLAKGMYNEAMGVAHGLYEVGAVISHVKLSDIHLVHSLSDYTSNLKNTTKLAFTSVGDSLLSIANKNYTMLTSNSPAIAGYAAGQLAGDAIIAYPAPKGMTLASNAIKTVGAKTLGMFARTARGGESESLLFRKNVKSNDLNSGLVSVDKNLIEAMSRKGRIIDVATKGSDDYKYLNLMGAEGSTNTATPNHILIKEDASKSTLLEEFLHGTQNKLGVVNRLGTQGAEVHVKDFMIRHAKLLGLDNPADLRLLNQLKIEEIERLNSIRRF